MLCLTDIIFLFDLYKFSFLLLVEYSKRDESKVGPLSAYEVEQFKIFPFLLFYFSVQQRSDNALSESVPVNSSHTKTCTSKIATPWPLLQGRYFIELRCIHQVSIP